MLRPGLRKAVMALVTVSSITVGLTIVGTWCTWCQGAGLAFDLHPV